MSVIVPFFWCIVMLPATRPAQPPDWKPATGPALRSHTLHFPGGNDLQINLPPESTARVEQSGKDGEHVTLEVNYHVPRVPITARRTTSPTTLPAGYDLSLTIESSNAAEHADMAALHRAMTERATQIVGKVTIEGKVTVVELRGPAVQGYYFTVVPVGKNGRPLVVASTNGRVLTGGMRVSFNLIHSRNDRRDMEHALSVVRGIRESSRATSAPISVPTSAPTHSASGR